MLRLSNSPATSYSLTTAGIRSRFRLKGFKMLGGEIPVFIPQIPYIFQIQTISLELTSTFSIVVLKTVIAICSSALIQSTTAY